MKKNIILITDYAAPYEGNFIASLKKFEEVVRNKDYKIKFLFSKRSIHIDWVKKFSKEYEVYFFEEDIYSIMQLIKKQIDKNYKNILYSHFARHKTQMAIKTFCILHPRIKLVQHFHNHCKIPNTFPKKQIMSLAYKLYEGDLNIGCSESVAKSMPYNKRKITFVDNAIDLNRLDKTLEIKKEKEYKDKFVILMFGFDYYRKGVDLAINALKDIAREKNIILKLALTTNKEKIENIIKSKFGGEIPKWIKMLPPTENVVEYYSTADVFLSAAREEGFCYSLVEATYCGKRCISSRIGGVPIEIPGIITFESENVEDLRNKILYAIENDNNNEKEAKMYVENKYDLNRWASKIIKIM